MASPDRRAARRRGGGAAAAKKTAKVERSLSPDDNESETDALLEDQLLEEIEAGELRRREAEREGKERASRTRAAWAKKMGDGYGVVEDHHRPSAPKVQYVETEQTLCHRHPKYWWRYLKPLVWLLLALSVYRYLPRHIQDHISPYFPSWAHNPFEHAEDRIQNPQVINTYLKPFNALQQSLFAYTLSVEDAEKMDKSLVKLQEGVDVRHNLGGYIKCWLNGSACEDSHQVERLRKELKSIGLEETKLKIEDSVCHLCRDAISLSERISRMDEFGRAWHRGHVKGSGRFLGDELEAIRHRVSHDHTSLSHFANISTSFIQSKHHYSSQNGTLTGTFHCHECGESMGTHFKHAFQLYNWQNTLAKVVPRFEIAMQALDEASRSEGNVEVHGDVVGLRRDMDALLRKTDCEGVVYGDVRRGLKGCGTGTETGTVRKAFESSVPGARKWGVGVERGRSAGWF